MFESAKSFQSSSKAADLATKHQRSTCTTMLANNMLHEQYIFDNCIVARRSYTLNAGTTHYNGTSAIELLPVPMGAHCRHLPAAGS